MSAEGNGVFSSRLAVRAVRCVRAFRHLQSRAPWNPTGGCLSWGLAEKQMPFWAEGMTIAIVVRGFLARCATVSVPPREGLPHPERSLQRAGAARELSRGTLEQGTGAGNRRERPENATGTATETASGVTVSGPGHRAHWSYPNPVD
ncbi:hypothetical protein GCM10023082_01630 [Streptomyces tremellae]|uniref:Uncharacterized protein n=1 Tax=Streptomyces tremellae TaxID=1124239 RepID=A0ABP7DPG2_9ACTN